MSSLNGRCYIKTTSRTTHRRRIGFERICAAALFGLFYALSNAGASDFYVDASSPSAKDSNSGTASAPWKTITRANSTVVAGDTVFLRAGQYNASISPAAQGSASMPIVYRNFGSESATVTGNIIGLSLNGKSYITLSGIGFSNVSQFAALWYCTNITITNCTFACQYGSGQWSGLQLEHSSQSNIISGCTIHHWGSTASAAGDMIDVGNEADATDYSWYNRIENCTLYSAGHSLINLRSGHNIVRNCWMHNEAWSGGYGMRCMISDSYYLMGGWNLIESNRISFADSYYAGSVGALGVRTRFNIIRRNLFYNASDAGITMAGGGAAGDQAVWNHIYNNSFFTNGLSLGGTRSAILFQTWGAPFVVKSNSIVNNIFFNHYRNFFFDTALPADQTFANNWESGSPKFADISAAYTAATEGKPDLGLASNSPCIDAGGWLTKVTSANGSGTSMSVEDEAFFFAGFGAVLGDTIQLQGSTATARIIGISGKALILNRSLTWTNGQGVALPYNGVAPDIGAFEYLSGRPSPPNNLHIVNP